MMPAEGRFEGALREAAQEAALGNWKSASRLADYALRIAPDVPLVQLVCSRLFLRAGAAEQAAQCVDGREDPDALAIRAEALLVLGSSNESAILCQQLLARYALNAVETLPVLATRLCGSDPGFPGWVGVDEHLRLSGEVQAGAPLTVLGDGRVQPLRNLIRARGRNGLESFTCELPSGVCGPLVVCSRGRPLLGSGLPWPPPFELSGWVALESAALHGEVRLDWAPSLPLTVIVGSAAENVRFTVAPEGRGSNGTSFYFPLSQLPYKVSAVDVLALLPSGSRVPLCGSPVEIRPLVCMPICERPQRHPSIGRKSGSRGSIDVVVPVYTGYEETLACLESVLTTTTREQAELVVVNDASPDTALTAALCAMAADGRITLLTNPSNVGFPGTANRGIRLHPDRDIVLLNSDTRVFANWLERLRCAAYSADDVGTITPLGHAASITSYPWISESDAAEPACTSEEGEEIDRIASRVNARHTVDLPTGVGFCMYLRRDCLDEVGELDERTFGRGYGEENDFCLRARRLGWRHLAATGLFVWHRGGHSFGQARRVLKARNARVLNARYPGYESLVAEFVAGEALRTARRAIDMQRLLGRLVNPMLLLTFDLGGGVARHVDGRRSELTAAGHTVFVMYCMRRAESKGRVALCARVDDCGTVELTFDMPGELPALRAFLLTMQLTAIEIHHFLGSSGGQLLELVTGLAVAYRIYVHDYSWICPRVSLLSGNGIYCGEPSLSSCETCVSTHGSALDEPLSVAALRKRSSRLFGEATAVIVPTSDVRGRLIRYFPEVSFQVVPWEEPVIPARRHCPADKRIRVAVIGAISLQKGYRVLEACARDAAARDLPLDFIVIGYTRDDTAVLEVGRVFVTGPYTEEEVGSLLLREQCHVAFFPSVTPETWCYSLTHGLHFGLPIVAFDIGAIAERLRDTTTSYELLPLPATAADINTAIIRIRATNCIDLEKEPPMNTTVSKDDRPLTAELAASVQVLTLPEGIYAFSVKGGAATTTLSEGLALPALQVAAAPAKSSGTVEFLAGPGTYDRWLARSGDVVTAKISGGSAALLLTSVRSTDSSVLAIDLRKLDVKNGAGSGGAHTNGSPAENARPASFPEEPLDPRIGNDATVHALRLRILVHVQNTGDLEFTGLWAGRPEYRLRIEAFTVACLEEGASDLIEYRGVTADGFSTPWLSNGLLCGSRGRAIALTGFAARVKPALVGVYQCIYRGIFASGTIVGPFDDARLCVSAGVVDDALVGIELCVLPRGTAATQAAVA